jgi:hypothetical protein
MGKFIDLTGQKFGRLTVTERAGSKNKRALWRCVCECGNEVAVDSNSLRTGNTRSCGCLHIERVKAIGEANKIHGMFGTRLYMIWADMKRRCSSQNREAYDNYGGRGITVCDEWANSFEAFRDWALANGYRDDLTLDRKDANGDYRPDNCRWSTWKEQENNRRNNHLLTHGGKTQTMTQWAEETGILYPTLAARINVLLWDPEKALTTK